MKRQTVRLTENQFRQIVKESTKKILKESLFDEAEETFEKIREYYGENKDALIDSLWFFIDNKPGFINYMKKSLQYPEDEEDY